MLLYGPYRTEARFIFEYVSYSIASCTRKQPIYVCTLFAYYRAIIPNYRKQLQALDFASTWKLHSISTWNKCTYGRRIFWINAGAIQQHTTLIDEGRILIIVVSDIYRQGGGRCEPFGYVPCTILSTNSLSCIFYLIILPINIMITVVLFNVTWNQFLSTFPAIRK